MLNLFKKFFTKNSKPSFCEQNYIQTISSDQSKQNLFLGYDINYQPNVHKIMNGSNTLILGSMGSGKSVAGNFILSSLALTLPNSLIFLYDTKLSPEYKIIRQLDRVIEINIEDNLEESLINFLDTEIQSRTTLYNQNNNIKFEPIILHIDIFEFFYDKIALSSNALIKFNHLLRISRRYNIIINCLNQSSCLITQQLMSNFYNVIQCPTWNHPSKQLTKGQALHNQQIIQFPFDITNAKQFPLLNQKLLNSKNNLVKLATLSFEDLKNIKQNSSSLKNIIYPNISLESLEFWDFIHSGKIDEKT